ncbi:MAG: hypothetical protein CMN28_05085 [Salinisphaeraceae bacterium]|nr:hypothetical protein [Salinisphaeraceae bacterium]
MGSPGNGGAIHITDPAGAGSVAVTITGGSFTNNSAASEGGALWNDTGGMDLLEVIVGGAEGSGNTALGGAVDMNDGNGQGGGGVFNNGGTVEVEDSVISYNSAAGDVSSGGGLFNNEGGSMFISNTNVDFNTANRAGGGIESRANTTTRLDEGSTLSSNTANTTNTMAAAGGNGGGLHVTGNGNVDLEDVTVDSNTAAKEGGGLWPNTGTMNVFFSVVSNNQSLGDIGGEPQGADGQGGGGIFLNAGDGEGGMLNINGSQITGNSAVTGSGSGGGIFVNQNGVMNVAASIIGGNTAARAGGGIESRAGSTVELVGVVLSDNNANGANDSPGNGGGMHVSGTGANTNVRASLVADNVAASEGGGLWNAGGSEMTVDGTSLLRNTAAGATATEGGGALFQQAGTGGGMNVSFSRILLNSATGAAGSGGGIFVDVGGELDVDNSVIAGNSANRAGGGVENRAGTVDLFRVNLGGTDSSFGNMVGTNPGNGGGLHTSDVEGESPGQVEINESLVGYNTGVEGGGL